MHKAALISGRWWLLLGRHTTARRALLAAATAILPACFLSTDPADVELSGCWAAVFNIPGAGQTINITESGSTLTGAGSYQIEAGPSGDLTASGTRTGATFTLTLTFDYGRVEPLGATIQSGSRFDAYPLNAAGERQGTPTQYRRC